MFYLITAVTNGIAYDHFYRFSLFILSATEVIISDFHEATRETYIFIVL